MRYHDTLNSLDVLENVKTADCAKSAIAVVGSMNADYTIVADRLPKPGETVNGSELKVLPGGKSGNQAVSCLLYTSPSPRDRTRSRMPSSA